MKVAEITPIKLTANGSTSPFIPSGTEIVLIQAGKATVGKLYYELGDPSSIEIEHPLNEEILSSMVTSFLQAKKPAYLKDTDAKLVTCPDDIKKQMLWKN